MAMVAAGSGRLVWFNAGNGRKNVFIPFIRFYLFRIGVLKSYK
jgi:hypothetical protein